MRDFTTGNEANHILRFTLPMLLGNVFQQLYNIVDSVIVGKYLGDTALAAVGASFPIIFAVISLIIGIGIGSSVVISQYFGAKDLEKVRRASDTVYIFLMASGIVLSVAGVLCSRWIFQMLQLPDELMDQATTYLNVYLVGLVVMFGFNGTSAILRGIGDSKTPLYFLIVATIANIGLDLLFILVFKWGIAGAAWATVISQAGAFVAAILYLNRHHHLIKFEPRKLVFDRDIFKQSVRIGLPTGIQQTFVAMGAMALMGIVNTFGTSVIAGFTAASRIDNLAALPAMNFSAALSSFVGQNVGANKISRIYKGLRATLLMSIGVSILISVIAILWGDNIVGLFSNSPDVRAIGHRYLIIVCLFYGLFSVMFTLNGLLRGAGDTLIPMFITLFSLWVVRIPLAYLLSKIWGMGEVGIWWAIPIAWAFGALGAFLYFRRGNWKTKGIIMRPMVEPLEGESIPVTMD
jgi:putative MATE family efflux protein